MEVASEDIGVPGGVGWGVYTIFDEGDIYVSDLFQMDEDDAVRRGGVITGGTGRFFGASGTATRTLVGTDSEGFRFARFEFEFERAISSRGDQR